MLVWTIYVHFQETMCRIPILKIVHNYHASIFPVLQVHKFHLHMTHWRVQRQYWYVTHHLMVMHLHAKYHKPMWKNKKSLGWTRFETMCRIPILKIVHNYHASIFPVLQVHKFHLHMTHWRGPHEMAPISMVSSYLLKFRFFMTSIVNNKTYLCTIQSVICLFEQFSVVLWSWQFIIYSYLLLRVQPKF
jgi:hypothetical protein